MVDILAVLLWGLGFADRDAYITSPPHRYLKKEIIMGRAKAMMMEHEENLALGARYLVKAGLLEQCPYHEEIYGGGFWDLESDFWRNAMADRNRSENGPVPWAASMEAKDYTDTLKAAYEEYCGDGCGYCAKNMAE